MIPDFLQNPGGLPKPPGRSNGADSGRSAEPELAGDEFARALREQQKSRADGSTPQADSVDNGDDSRRSESPAASDPGGSKSKADAQSGRSSETSNASRSDLRAGASPADATRGATDERAVARTGEDSKLASLNGDSGSRSPDNATDHAPAASGGATDSTSPNAESEGGGKDLSGHTNLSRDTAIDNVADAESGGRPPVDSRVILVDAFSTEVEATTVTDDGLQLDVADEVDSKSETAGSAIGDESQFAHVEVGAGQTGDASQPFVLSSLVSIAVAESALLRRQQAHVAQDGTNQKQAGDTAQLNSPQQSGSPSDGNSAGVSGLPIDRVRADVENPVLPSLVAARTGHRADQPVQKSPSQTAVGDDAVEQGRGGSGDVRSRSEVTPQGLTVDQLAVRSPSAGKPVEEVPAADSEVAVQQDGKTESASVDGEPARRVKTVISDSDVAAEELSASEAAESTPQADDSLRDSLRRTGDQESAAGREKLSIVRRATEDSDSEAVERPQTSQSRSATASSTSVDQFRADADVPSKASAGRIAEVVELPPKGTDLASTADDGREGEVRLQLRAAARSVRNEASGASVAAEAEGSSSVALNPAGDDSSVRRSAAAVEASAQTVRTKAGAGATSAASHSASGDQSSVGGDGGSRLGTDAGTDTVAQRDAAADLAPSTAARLAAVGGVASAETPVAPSSPNEVAVASPSPAQGGNAERASVDSPSTGGSLATETSTVATGGTSVSAGEAAVNPSGGEADAPVIGGPDRFLSPNVQRALSAIRSAAEGGSRLRVQLNPVELGALLVEIEQTPQGIVARLEVGNAAAHSLLVDSLADLQQSLSRSHSPVDRIDVVLTENRTETSRQQREQGQQRDQPEQRGQQQRGDAESERRRRRDERAKHDADGNPDGGESRVEAA